MNQEKTRFIKAIEQVLDKAEPYIVAIMSASPCSVRDDFGLTVLVGDTNEGVLSKRQFGVEPERYEPVAMAKWVQVVRHIKPTRWILQESDRLEVGDSVWSGGDAKKDGRVVVVSGFWDDALDDVIVSLIFALWDDILLPLCDEVKRHRNIDIDYVERPLREVSLLV